MENHFPSQSPLIVPALEDQLKQLLQKLTADVELTCILDGGDKSLEMAGFLNHLTALSPRLSCTFLDAEEDPALSRAMDAQLLPATGIGTPGTLPRMVFHGIPGGKEITSFAAAILNAGGAAKPLDKYTLKDIGKIKRPMELQICVSLGCQHCAQLVANAQRVAWENPLVTAHMIDANLYPQLVDKLNIQRVPLLVVNQSQSFPGGKTMAELTTLLPKLQ